MKLEVWITTNKVGSKCSTVVDIDNEELEGLSDEQKEGVYEDYAREEIWNMAEWGWETK